MRLKFKLATAVAASAVAAAAALFATAAPASAVNPPYSGCPSWSLCLYQNGGGYGTKVIVALTPGSKSTQLTLYDVHFLNGIIANNQVSSWLNNSNCYAYFWDEPGQVNPPLLDFAPLNAWGATGDFSFGGPKQWANDRLSFLQFYCA